MSDSDGKTFNTEITADPANFLAGFNRAVAGATQGANTITSVVGNIGGAFAKLQAPLLAVAGLFAGGKFFKDAIDASNKLVGESMSLAKSLGITGTEASALNTALGDIGSDSDTYIGAFQKFAKQIKNNEEGLQAMGLQTRDSNGHLRDSNTLFTEALQKVGEYKPGLDQTTAAMTLFGKGVDDVMKLQKLNSGVIDEARKKNEELGLTLTKEGVDASKKYKLALNDVGDVFIGIKNVIGQAVMPIFTRLAEWFVGVGPTAVFVFKVAIDAVATAIQAVILIAKTLWNVLRALADPLFVFGGAVRKLISGDINGATADMMKMGESWGKSLSGVFDIVKEDATRTWKEIGNLWGKGTEVAAPGKGTKTMGDFGKTNGGATREEPSRVSGWDAQLQAASAALERQGMIEGQYRTRSLADNLAFWQTLLQRKDLSDKERQQLTKKAAEVELASIKENFEVQVATINTLAAAFKNNTDVRLALERVIQGKYQEGTKEYEASAKRIVEIQRQAAEQEKQIQRSRVEAEREARLQVLALEEQTVQQALQLGVITQADVLAAQQQFELRRTEIAREALVQRLADAQSDPDRNPVEVERINRELEQLEQQHQLRLAQLRNASMLDSSKNITSTLGSIESGWASLLQKLGTGTLTISGFIKGVFSTAAQAVIGTLAKMAAQWAIQQVAMKVFGKAITFGRIGEEAAKAGAGGIASMAAAPFPLNLTAPAFGAAMSAAAMAFAPLASAAQGYDIPSNVNPIVQTHAREMILPAKHADVIRAMAEGDAGGVGGGTLNYHDHSGKLTPMMIRDNAKTIARELSRLGRQFYTP